MPPSTISIIIETFRSVCCAVFGTSLFVLEVKLKSYRIIDFITIPWRINRESPKNCFSNSIFSQQEIYLLTTYYIYNKNFHHPKATRDIIFIIFLLDLSHWKYGTTDNNAHVQTCTFHSMILLCYLWTRQYYSRVQCKQTKSFNC